MWWQALGTLTLSALSLAVAAGWIETTTGRRINRIEAHLRIADKLSDGTANDALTKHLETEILEHLAALESASVRRWRHVATTLAIVCIAVGLGLSVVVVLVVAGRLSGATLIWTSGASILLSFITNKAVDRAQRETTEAADDHDPKETP